MKLLVTQFSRYIVSSCHLRPDILITLLSNIFIHHPSFRVRDQVSHPCRTTYWSVVT